MRCSNGHSIRPRYLSWDTYCHSPNVKPSAGSRVIGLPILVGLTLTTLVAVLTLALIPIHQILSVIKFSIPASLAKSRATIVLQPVTSGFGAIIIFAINFYFASSFTNVPMTTPGIDRLRHRRIRVNGGRPKKKTRRHC